jgi:hypothetical protein
MPSPQLTWRSLCFKLATEEDPIRVAVFVELLNELVDSYVRDLRSKNPPGTSETGLSSRVH